MDNFPNFDGFSGLNVNYDAYYPDFNETEIQCPNILTRGVQTYAISPLSRSDKFSKRIADCTSILGIGVSSKSQKNLSFLSHQGPNWVYNESNCIYGLRRRIFEMMKRCDIPSIRCLVLGGHSNTMEYEKKIEVLKKQINPILKHYDATQLEVIPVNIESGNIAIQTRTQLGKIDILQSAYTGTIRDYPIPYGMGYMVPLEAYRYNQISIEIFSKARNISPIFLPQN